MLFEAVVLLLCIWYAMFHIKRRRLYKLAAEFDGPTPLPLIGNALNCIMSITEMPNAILKNTGKYKSPIRFWFGPYLVLYISSPADIKTVLNNSHSQGKIPYIYSSSEIVLGRGLVTIPVDEWKRHRRLISPHFNQFNLDRAFGVLIHYSSVLIKNLKGEVGKEFFDAEYLLSNCAVRLVLDALLGFKSADDKDYRSKDVLQLLKDMQDIIVSRLSNILYFSNFIFDRSSSGKKLKESKEELSTILQSFVEKVKEELKEHPIKDNNFGADSGSSRPVNFAEHLLLTVDGMGKLEMDELKGEIQTFIVAGFDTIAITMGYFLLIMGIHPEIQEKVYQEIENVLGEKNQLQQDDLNNLEYLERVIKETLRMFPPLLGIGRKNDQEINLENHIIPVNTNILIGTLSLHRDPSIWPNPNTFDPDRFLPEEEEKRHPYSWIPFSAGPRNCIGFKFGLMAVKVLAAMVVKNYKINAPYKSVTDIPLSMYIALRPTDGYNISITSR